MPKSARPLEGRGTIGVDRSSLKNWGMGRTGYSVNLTAPVEGSWIDSFRRVEAKLGLPWRFYLDAKNGVVAFGTDRELTAKALDRLDEIVAAANSEAAGRHPVSPAFARENGELQEPKRRR